MEISKEVFLTILQKTYDDLCESLIKEKDDCHYSALHKYSNLYQSFIEKCCEYLGIEDIK